VKESLDREAALSNAPLKEDGYFKVPKVLED
jgi:aspartyl-tRNA(Asn)/glutamyl-tRNA(Gln) amidotransferase subunit C